MPRLLLVSTIFLNLLAARASSIAAPLDEQLERIRAEKNLPALAALAMKGGKILAESAVGVRKIESPEKVTTQDVWHIGSCTKSMTATLAALLAQEGKIRWDSTVEEVFPEFRDKLNPGWCKVTLEQFLTQRSGAPHDAPPDLWSLIWTPSGSVYDLRAQFVSGLLSRPPNYPPGSKFVYSNQGYVIAGAMLERASKLPWEQLIQRRLFDPLQMKTAGFGAPATLGLVDQPWGHAEANGKLTPISPGPRADNPPALGPAGAVHCSLRDLARYCGIHADGERAGWNPLPPDVFRKLHTAAPGQDYALGWDTAERGWGGGKVLCHNGSNTMFYVVIWMAPLKNAVFISATNCACAGAAPGCDEAVATMIHEFLE